MFFLKHNFFRSLQPLVPRVFLLSGARFLHDFVGFIYFFLYRGLYREINQWFKRGFSKYLLIVYVIPLKIIP